jgi:integrase
VSVVAEQVLGQRQAAAVAHVVGGRKAMSNVCQSAIDDGLMRSNPTRKFKAPRPEPSTKVVPTREQVAQMIAAAPDARARALVVVLAYTGLRIGEALSLRWSDWDGAGTIQVRGKGGKMRAVPVTRTLAEELKAWRKVQAAERMAAVWWGEGDYILSTPVGTKWDPSNARKQVFLPLANGTPASEGVEAVPGICPGATPHSLRHAAATMLLEEGVPMKVVSELLGHSSTRVTAETYSHVTARLVAEAGAAIERALG